MKWSIVLLGLCTFGALASAADIGLDEVQQLGRLNGQALACAQQENISRIKTVMITHAPKSRQYGASFEQSTNEAFLQRTAASQDCGDASLIALQVESLAARLQQLFAAPRQQ